MPRRRPAGTRFAEVIVMSFKRWLGWFVACVLLAVCRQAQVIAAGPAESELSPFVLPWDDGSAGPTSLAFLNHVPAGKFGPIRPGPDGHFYAGKERIRFFGVNLCFGGTVPDPDAATRIAARMARFGINAVRFHHMDGQPFPSGLIRRGAGSGDLDPQALERLSFFVAELKKQGIYTNLNLLVSRNFRSSDGLPAEIETLDWKLRHTVAMYYPPMIELQKQYARGLLMHRNPHTGLAFAEDPAVAFVEINNENGLILHWLAGDLDDLPGEFGKDLVGRWNQWLRDRYKTTANLRRAWNAPRQPMGAELLVDPAEPAARQGGAWNLERHAGAAASNRIESEVAGRPTAVRIQVERTGREGWHVQFNHPGLKVKAGGVYTLAFQARAEPARSMRVLLGQAHEPWRDLGFNVRVELTPEWREYRFTMAASSDDGNARISFSDLATETGAVWLSGVSFRPGGDLGLEADERIERGNVPLIRRRGTRGWPEAARRDFVRFLRETESRYWETMRGLIRDELGFKGVVMGTIISCSPPHLQAGFDAVDGHAYWQHPHFPRRPWDPEDWFVRNLSMVNEPGGVLAGLSMQRVAGKPFTVTEYNHSSPNTYSGEAPILLAGHAALQDWDGVFLFAYAHSSRWDSRKIDSFFDIGQHPVKMANLAPAALLLRAGHVAPARETVVRGLDAERELEVIVRHGRAWKLVELDHLGVDPSIALLHRTAIRLDAQAGADDRPPVKPDDPALLVSDTGQITWDRRRPGKGVVCIDTPRTKGVVGFTAGRSFRLGEVTIRPGATVQDWCTICLSLVEGESFSGPGRGVLVATGWAQNTGMRWKDAERTSVGRAWGQAPSRVEVVRARISLPVSPERLEAWSLDERGQRLHKLSPQPDSGGGSALEIGSQPTLWYELRIR